MLSVLTIEMGCLRLTNMYKQIHMPTYSVSIKGQGLENRSFTTVGAKLTESRSLRAFTKGQFDSLKKRKLVLPVTLYQL